MCQSREMPRFIGMRGCGCGCGPGFRRFFSTQEERDCLESYKDQLEKELAGIEERIKQLKPGKTRTK